MNQGATQFRSLISFDYSEFVALFPQWRTQRFQDVMENNARITTQYRVHDITEQLLRYNFRYWEKGTVEILIQDQNRWVPLDEIIAYEQPGYAPEELVFLGLGTEDVVPGDISEEQFLSSYFNNRNFFLTRPGILKVPSITIRLHRAQ